LRRVKNEIKSKDVGIIGFLVATGLIVDVWTPINLVNSEVEARVGRPATPGSVAGVARRTTRRTIRRSTIYIASLPRGCTTVVIEGQSCYQCVTTSLTAPSMCKCMLINLGS
jgi:hypothetical protein